MYTQLETISAFGCKDTHIYHYISTGGSAFRPRNTIVVGRFCARMAPNRPLFIHTEDHLTSVGSRSNESGIPI